MRAIALTLLRDLIPGGAPTELTADKATILLRGVRPLTTTGHCRRELAGDLRKLAEGHTPAEDRRALKDASPTSSTDTSSKVNSDDRQALLDAQRRS